MKNSLAMIFIIFATAMLMACGIAEYDWNKALSVNTVAAYQVFLQNHSDDPRAGDARGRMLALQDDQRWVIAQKANTVESFQTYLHDQPGGIHVGQAHYYIIALQRATAWKTIQHNASTATLQAFLQQYRQGLESNEAREQLKTLTAYRIELSDAQTKAEAEKKRTQIQMRYGTVVHGITVNEPTAPNTVYRVLSEPMSQADATSACAALEHAHQSCTLVPNS